MKVGAGSIVLNQNPTKPMSGIVIAVGPGYNSDTTVYMDALQAQVRWANNETFIEQLSDLTLTAALILERE